QLCQKPEFRVTSYSGVKYSTNGLATYNPRASGGKLSTFTTRECSTALRTFRPRTGSTRSDRVTGAPRARNIGTIIDNNMCWTMWMLNSTVSYVPSTLSVAI